MINKDTKIYCSFSENPGNNGGMFFNDAFKRNNIDAIYKSFYSNNIKKSVIIKNTNPQLEQLLEPWFNGGDGIIVEIDGKTFTQQEFDYVQQLSEILADSTFLEEDMGSQFEVGNITLTIKNVDTYEKKLIKWEEE